MQQEVHDQGSARKRCRVAIYARYSSDKQNPESANDQIDRARKRLADAKIRPRRFPPDEYFFDLVPEWIKKDEAKTGRTTDREGYEQILSGIRGCHFEVILVDDLSRLTRTLGSLIDLYDLLRFHGVELYSISDSLSSEDPNAKISFQVKGIVNEMGNEAHAHRTKRGQEQKKVNGFSTGDICYGYGSRPTRTIRKGSREVPTDFRPYVIPHEADVVRGIFELYLGGKGCGAIAKHLNRRKVPSPRRTQGRTGEMYSWGPTTIKTILSNTKYIGIWTWSQYELKINPETGVRVRVPRPEKDWIYHLGERNTVDHELVIVPREMWEGVRQRMHLTAREFKQAGSSAEGMRKVKTVGANCQTMLSSVLRCHECGGPLVQVSGKGDGYYGCYVYHRKDQVACSQRRLLPCRKVEAAVIEKLRAVLCDPKVIDAATERYNKVVRQRLKSAPTRTIALEQRLHLIKTETANLVAFVLTSGAATPVSIREALSGKEEEQARAQAELDLLKSAGEDKVFLTSAAMRLKFQSLSTYLDRDEEIANRVMKLFFRDGLVARPADSGDRSGNPNRRWTVSGNLVLAPEEEPPAERFNGLVFGGRRISIVEPMQIRFEVVI